MEKWSRSDRKRKTSEYTFAGVTLKFDPPVTVEEAMAQCHKASGRVISSQA